MGNFFEPQYIKFIGGVDRDIDPLWIVYQADRKIMRTQPNSNNEVETDCPNFEATDSGNKLILFKVWERTTWTRSWQFDGFNYVPRCPMQQLKTIHRVKSRRIIYNNKLFKLCFRVLSKYFQCSYLKSHQSLKENQSNVIQLDTYFIFIYFIMFYLYLS